jgi:hypothetical protein
MQLLADVAVGPIFFLFPPAGILFLVLVIGIEAFILRRRQWGTGRESLKDAAIANLISTLIGVVPGVLLLLAAFQCSFPSQRNGFRTCTWVISPLIILALMWGASVLIEGGVLLRMRHHLAGETWKTLVIANLVSYILLSPFFIFV